MGLDITARVAARYVAANTLDAEMLTKEIASALDPVFSGMKFGVYRNLTLGGDGVSVEFFRAPKGANDLDIWNSPVYVKVSIDGVGRAEPPRPGVTPGLRWYKDQPAPEKVKAEMVRSRGVKFRARSGDPVSVARYVIQWFKANAAALKGEG